MNPHELQMEDKQSKQDGMRRGVKDRIVNLCILALEYLKFVWVFQGSEFGPL